MRTIHQRVVCRLVLILLLCFILLQYRLLQMFIREHDQGQDNHFRQISSQHIKVFTDNDGNDNNPQWLCTQFPRGIVAASVWKRYQERLLEGLIHPRDAAEKIHFNWTRQLLELLTPTVLDKSLKSFPSSSSLKIIYKKLHARIHNPHKNPPLKIFVFGGSVVEGSGCNRSPAGKLNIQSLQECAWPFRLQHLLNHLFGQSVEVYNLAAGGTHSEAAIPVMEYWLSPAYKDAPPDILINAYSANDNLPPVFHATTNTTIDHFHLYRIAKRNQDFIQVAKRTSGACSTPLILFVNDYLGNQQESIWGEGQLDEVIQWLADMDDSVGYISPAHMVKHWVFANTSETIFSGRWTDRHQKPAIDVHFGMVGHMTTSLAVLYGLLQFTIDFCEHVAETTCHERPPAVSSLDDTESATRLVEFGLPSKEWVEDNQPPVIVPKLRQLSWNATTSTLLEKLPLHASKNESISCRETGASRTATANEPYDLSSPCVFAFLAAPLGTHRRQDRLAEYLRPFTLMEDGWQPQDNLRQDGFQNKLGLVATKPSAKMILGFHHILKPVKMVTIHYLKSYGPQWVNSRVRMTLELFWKKDIIHTQTMELEGFHDQQVSISYFSKWELQGEDAPIGSSIRFQMELIGGETFKINALMFCSR